VKQIYWDFSVSVLSLLQPSNINAELKIYKNWAEVHNNYRNRTQPTIRMVRVDRGAVREPRPPRIRKK